ncbi:MAG: GntR family transcriptional regulator [Planctomycetaceae bacterium]|jgi:GntR family transcriptional regulator|nr:GntR family transcriptional regulator [Planctomycetaceae bacterium]MCE2812601.1 GntR family transcriptional regulator [Planctomycetaceae bacterium]
MITISLDSPVPLHDQLVSELRGLIALGKLQVGDELPSVRQLAADLGINLNTVARAYRELTDAGLLASGRGRGTVVISTVEKTRGPQSESRQRLENSLASALADAKIAGLSLESIQAIFIKQAELIWKNR